MSESSPVSFSNKAAAIKFLEGIKNLTEREAAEKHGFSISQLRIARSIAKKTTQETK